MTGLLYTSILGMIERRVYAVLGHASLDPRGDPGQGCLLPRYMFPLKHYASALETAGILARMPENNRVASVLSG